MSQLWNAEKKQFRGRRRREWAEICAFYLVFYLTLLAWFLAMMCFFGTSIDPFEPTLQGSESSLQHPGLAFRPQPDFSSNVIIFSNDRNDPGTKKLVENMKQALKPYHEAAATNWTKYWADCNIQGSAGTFPCKVLHFPENSLKEGCEEENGFGFYNGTPCVMFRLNKIYGWTPADYTQADRASSPIPEDWRTTELDHWTTVGFPALIWLWCDGKTEEDRKAVGDDLHHHKIVTYRPFKGFPFFYYPYLNQMRYLQPFVMVQFKTIRPNTRVHLLCRVWARNIEYILEEGQGAVEFELQYNMKF